MSFKSGIAPSALATIGDELYVRAAAVLSSLQHNEYFTGLNVASLVSIDDEGIKKELVMRDSQGRQLVHVANHDSVQLLRDFQQACMDYNDLKLKAAELHG